jgi:hypothetical protein
MCPLAGWASRGWQGVGKACPGRGDPGHEADQAMNIRAAEAMVSNAPKAIKIFPISEV